MLIEIQVSPNLQFGGIPITDWIQALGGLIAIFAGIWGFIKLFIKDEERKNEIDSLILLSQESQLQTKQLAFQTIHMEASNKLLEEQVELFKSQLNLNHQSFSNDIRQNEVDAKIRKNNILPRFVQFGGGGYNDKLRISIRNEGEIGQFIETKIIDNEANIFIMDIPDKSIARGESIDLSISRKNQNVDLLKTNFNFKLLFENKNKDKYYQLVSCQGLKCEFSYPQEI